MRVDKNWSRLWDLHPWRFQDKCPNNLISLDLFEKVSGLEDMWSILYSKKNLTIILKYIISNNEVFTPRSKANIQEKIAVNQQHQHLINPTNIAAHSYRGKKTIKVTTKRLVRGPQFIALWSLFQLLFVRIRIPQLSTHNLRAFLYQ